METSKHFQSIQPFQVENLLSCGNEPSIIDVRTPAEFFYRRIPTAKLVPLDQLKRANIELHTDDAVIIVCEHGIRSAVGAQLLAAMGLENVSNMEGGMASYHGPCLTEVGRPELST